MVGSIAGVEITFVGEISPLSTWAALLVFVQDQRWGRKRHTLGINSSPPTKAAPAAFASAAASPSAKTSTVSSFFLGSRGRDMRPRKGGADLSNLVRISISYAEKGEATLSA